MKSLKTFSILTFLFFSFNLFGQQNTFEWSDTTFEIGDSREIYYDQWEYYDNSSIIDTIADFLKRNPELKIEIAVHTDARNSDRFNQELSRRKARAIFLNLKEKGVSIRQMEHKGYGATQPISKGNCEEKHQRNRRTQITILNNQLFFYQKLLKEDSIAQVHYFEHLDYFEFSQDNFQQEFDSLANYFKRVLKQDSTLLLTIEHHMDATGNKTAPNHPTNYIFNHITQKHQINQDKVKMDGFYTNTKGSIYSARPDYSILIRLTSKAEYEDYKGTSIKKFDKCKSCPF